MTCSYFDSHAHFDKFAGKGEMDEVLERAASNGVTQMIAMGGNKAANNLAVSLAKKYPGVLFAASGYDRDQAEGVNNMDVLKNQLQQEVVVAVGEIGLDYHYHAETAPVQRQLLEVQLELALEMSLPVVIHSREADDDTITLLEAYSAQWKSAGKAPGVLHCFTGTPSFAERILALGFMVSFSGILTFNNADQVREAARLVPLERLLIETDCPYLTPVPHRGTRNEPAWVVHVAEKLAEIHGCTAEKMATITRTNACSLFSV